MKSKQLGNVLIKLLGLSILIQGAPSLITGLCWKLIAPSNAPDSVGISSWAYVITSFVQVFIGMFLISSSRGIADWLLRAEDE